MARRRGRYRRSRVEPEQSRGEAAGIEPGVESLGRHLVVAGRHRPAYIQVRRLGEVAVGTQTPHVEQVSALRGVEDAGLAAIDLTRGFQEDDLVGKEARKGEARVVDAVLPPEEVLDEERPVGPGQDVVVHLVHLAEGAPHLPDLEEEAAG
jgi:hypothetical protein